jgi:tetratricopeptide (TPR) repeat protein
VTYHLNVDSTQNKPLVDQFKIHSIPSFVFVDNEGNEVDRIVGYLPPKEYLTEMTRIRNGINTIPDLVHRLETELENADLLISLAGKLEVSSGLKAAMSYWEILLTMESADAATHSLAGLKMALFHAQDNNDPATLLAFIENETNIEILPKAFDALRNFYRGTKDKTAEADTYRRYVDFMSGINQVDPGFLNGYAWRMTQLEMNLENALERIEQAIELFTDQDGARERAQIMDTEGEVLWKLGRIDEAVAVMEACIVLQPEDKYYQEQKTKFLAKDQQP